MPHLLRSHLLGFEHSADPTNIMAPVVPDAVPGCPPKPQRVGSAASDVQPISALTVQNVRIKRARAARKHHRERQRRKRAAPERADEFSFEGRLSRRRAAR